MDQVISNYVVTASSFIVIIISIISLYTLGKGADILVDHAVNISTKLNVPKAVIGATIVSLGTTLPETSVSVLAAMNGNPDMALGNAIGSIIADTGLIIGLVAMMKPLEFNLNSIKFQSWMQFGAGLLITIFCLPMWHSSGQGNVTQIMGFVLVAILIFYLYYSIKHPHIDSVSEESPSNTDEASGSLVVDLLLMFAGIVIVIVSSKVLIPSVEVLALRAGIPQSIIAATLVAFGTSLPELTTAVKSVQKGHGDLAIGNIIGADILNVLFVTGAAASVTPLGLNVPSNFYTIQLPFMMVILTIFRIYTLQNKPIGRFKGGILLGAYVIYILLNYVPTLLA